jgi:pyrimidine deaminase RibD-like protein
MRRAERTLMERTIELAKLCRSESGKVRPKVGALIAIGDKVLSEGFRGEVSDGDHAEYTVLIAKKPSADLAGAVLYTTLEPCTSRVPPKIPCCQRVIDSGIKYVVIGMVDPNDKIRGNGIWALRQKQIQIELFDADLMNTIEVLNKDFIEPHLAANSLIYSPHFLKPSQRRLDDWYHTTNSIYLDRNFYRTAESIFSHLVEILGGLSLLATDKKKSGVIPEQFVTKALAWWLALCGKVGIRSVEDMLWCKYPGVCPYCLKNPHEPDECKRIKKKSKDPDWKRLAEIGKASERPASLSEWQKQFNSLYKATDTDRFENTFGRFTEELGELAEAVRVVEVAPGYFISEASDVFAWLMKVANIINFKRLDSDKAPLVLEDEIFNAYPDRCLQCGYRICACPPILATTLGRLAHEGPDIESLENPIFVSNRDLISRFDVGSTVVRIGTEELKVTDQTLSEIYSFATSVLQALRTKPGGDSISGLVGVLQNIAGLAAVQRVSQNAIDDLLRKIVWLRPSDRDQFIQVVESCGGSDLVTLVVAFLKAAIS